MAGIAGSVAPVFRDEGYLPDATYDFYHALIHNNKLYFCRKDGTIGHEPQEESDEYWFLSLDGNFADAASLGGKPAREYALTADLANYLSLTGGQIDSTSHVPLKINSTNAENEYSTIAFLKGGAEYGRLGMYGKDTPIFRMADNGYVKRLLHEGNVGDYALPITGGTVEIAGIDSFGVKRTSANMSCIAFLNNNGYLGYLGIDKNYEPVFRNTSNVSNTLHHDGNSAKVAIQESAPTDTSALWVDTANKVTKAYIDGAWTQVA